MKIVNVIGFFGKLLTKKINENSDVTKENVIEVKKNVIDEIKPIVKNLDSVKKEIDPTLPHSPGS